MAISVPENLVLAASATGSLPLADIKYIKGAFKVFETAAEMQNVIVSQVTDNQIVWLEASSSLYQATINPANPPLGIFFPTVSWSSFSFPGGGGGSVDTGSLMTTASVALNTITFTKGDGTTFPITVDTGSGGSGGSADLTQELTANLTVGGITSGDSFASGSSMEQLLRDMLITYQEPTLGALSIRNGGSAINTTIYDVGASFTCDDATFTAGVDSPNGDYPQSASLSCTGADIGSFSEDGPNDVQASNTITFSTTRTISIASNSGTVSFTVTTDSRNSGDTQSRNKDFYFRWRNYLAASSTIINSDSTLQSVLDNDLVQSPLDTNRSWTATCGAANNTEGNYTYIIYPASYGNLSNIIQNGATPVLEAFGDGVNSGVPVGDFTADNSLGSSRSWRVYKSNADQAFGNGTTLAIS